MGFSQELVGGLDLALNEATVEGFEVDQDARTALMLLQVVAVRESDGQIDPDARRAVTLHGVSRVEVVLRTDPLDRATREILPVEDPGALTELMTSLTFIDAMYGWRFTNIVPEEDWPAKKSLILTLVDAPAANTLYWFAECRRQDGDDYQGFVLEVLVFFGALIVMRADGTELPTEQFISDARRWWEAFRQHSTAVSVQAQQAALSPSWRHRDPGTEEGAQ